MVTGVQTCALPIFHAELGVPVKYIGVGETIDDLQKFNADDFVNALFERPKDDEASEEVSENE